MKTAVTVLQEMMTKLGQTPEYECIAQSGPQHQSMFDYRCIACGVVVTASARSKKEAKQEVARLMLQKLSTCGYQVPPPYGISAAMHGDPMMSAGSSGDTRSYVALLKELCEEYRLTSVEYELVGDTGPPHLRHFTIKARIGQHERFATSTTKKAARQLAAEKLYTYLRENLTVTRDFNEEDALIRAHEKTMERYTDSGDDHPRRPDLGQIISEYHLGLASRLDEETRTRALAALAQARDLSATRALQAVAEALHLELEYSALECEAAALTVVQVSGCSPELAFAARGPGAAADSALQHVRRALRTPPSPSPSPSPTDINKQFLSIHSHS